MFLTSLKFFLFKVTFIVLGFVIMVLVQLIEGEHDHHHHGDEHCQIDPSKAFINVTKTQSSVNVTCIHGKFTIL